MTKITKVPDQHNHTNALSIDVEDYFQVSAFSDVIDRKDWNHMECRVESNTNRILDVLAENKSYATFFTLGWVAERYPAIVRRIIADGHELASHGYAHRKVTEQTPEEFRSDVILAKNVLEDISGAKIVGYRAPSFSIGANNLWAHDLLAETGHAYSSSVYPISHDHYGMPNAPRFPYKTVNGLLEIPPSSIRMFNKNWPASGGGYFRLLPYTLSKWGFARLNRIDNEAAIFYMHPWEIDIEQPRIEAPFKSRFRHYVNLAKVMPRLKSLLQDFRWDRMDRVFKHQLEN